MTALMQQAAQHSDTKAEQQKANQLQLGKPFAKKEGYDHLQGHEAALTEIWEYLDADKDRGVTATELKAAFKVGDHTRADDPEFFNDAEGAARQ